MFVCKAMFDGCILTIKEKTSHVQWGSPSCYSCQENVTVIYNKVRSCRSSLQINK